MSKLPIPNTTIRLTRTQTAVNGLIHDYINSKLVQVAATNQSYHRLWQEIDTHFAYGGKRIRPYLIMLSYDAYGGKDWTVALQIAAAWELLHGATLMHDDIIDDDYTRHNHPNIAGRYEQIYKNTLGSHSTQHYANSAALLAGDITLSTAFQFIMTSQLSAEQKVQAAQMLYVAIDTVIGGELLDVEASLLPIGTINPYMVAEYKTAGYSFVSPLIIGATMAQADANQITYLQKYGSAVGTTYQIIDDMLSMFGDEATIGKSALSDLQEGKRTVILHLTYELASNEQQQRIRHILSSKDIGSDMLLEIRQLTIDTGAKAAVEKVLNDFEQQAISAVNNLAIDEACKAELTWVARMARQRNA